MNKVLIVCGQTATGKTKLALKLAEKYKADILSADSRQVYKDVDIGVGKDLPADFRIHKSDLLFENEPVKYYTNGKVRVWGLDIVSLDSQFSASQFRKYSRLVISNAHKKSRMVIVAGGSGFYIRAILPGNELVDVPPDDNLRSKMSRKSAKSLFQILQKEDLSLAESLGKSERSNPRRLIRKIEVSRYLRRKGNISSFKEPVYDILWVGLFLPRDKLKNRIKLRIKKRIDLGFEKERRKVLAEYPDSEVLANTPGYRSWPDKEKWLLDEYKYSKRQMTWFKKNKKINWFYADKKNLLESVDELVSRWYSKW